MLVTNPSSSGLILNSFSVNKTQLMVKTTGALLKSCTLQESFYVCLKDCHMEALPKGLLCVKLGQTLEVLDTAWAKTVTQVSY